MRRLDVSKVVAGFVLLALVLTAPSSDVAADGGSRSPYVDFEGREIKALSEDEVAGLLEGRGMGLALAAELNRHPGPKHVLELAEPLGLTAEQRRLTQQSFDVMHAEALTLGRQILEQEAAIDRLFASDDADAAQLAALVGAAAELRGRLRLAHLAAHLEMKRILSTEQVAKYAGLRGYAEHSGAPADCPHAGAGPDHDP